MKITFKKMKIETCSMNILLRDSQVNLQIKAIIVNSLSQVPNWSVNIVFIKEKSIVLEQDMDNAFNDDEEMDKIKEEALQQEFSSMKNSQVIMDSLNERS